VPRSGHESVLGKSPESAKLSFLFSAMTFNKSNDSAATRAMMMWLLLVLVVGACVAARIRLLALPLERDEGEYAYTGQLLLQGIPPDQLAYSMKFPGTAALYAVLMSIFGESATGIHLGLIFLNVATIALLGFVGRVLFGTLPGIAAAAAYAVLSLMPHVLGTAAHASHFVMIFVLAGCLLLLTRENSTRLRLAMGCLFGLAMLMKQPGLFFVIFAAVYLLSRDLRARLDVRRTIIRGALFLAGAATAFLITCLILWKAGVFDRFWFWTIKYAREYGSQVSLIEGTRMFGGHFFSAIGTAWPIWALAAIGLILCFVDPRLKARAGFLVTFAGFSALAVCPGFYFRPHYFIFLLPALALLVGASFAAATEFLQAAKSKLTPAVILLFAGCLAWPIWSEADFFFERPLPVANRMINGTNPFPESIKIGQYVREHSSPGDSVAVLGSEPQIYFYSRRHSATGYIYTYGLMEAQPYAHQMQEEMIREIETARPKFVVLVVINTSWLIGRDSDQTIFRWADRYCEANYKQVGLINITEQGTDYFLDTPQSNLKPSAEHIAIYERK
jgi:4-amino-4-deoxy-L-arabinose transferase-like glycosyltransferase